MNKRAVASAIGKVLWVEAGLMILPVLMAFLYREGFTNIISFIASIVILGLSGWLLGANKSFGQKLYTKEGLVITGLSWVALSSFGALPFVFSGQIPSFVDAFFETVSGFTTTGSSILKDVEALSHSMLFWRSFSHFIGGMGILVFTMAIIPRLSDDSVQIMKAEVPGPVFGKVVAKTGSHAKILYIIYLVMWFITFLLLILAGMAPFDSALHAFGAAGTGGFGIRNGSLLTYNSVYIEAILGFAMILFGVNFNLYFYMLKGKFRQSLKDEELRWYLAIIVLSIMFITFQLRDTYETFFERLRHTFFAVSSIITTTGFSTVDFNLWPLSTHIVLLLIMFTGAMAGSTAGGIKVSRIAILVKTAMAEIGRTREPKRVMTTRYDGRSVGDSTLGAVVKYLVVYVLIFWGLVFIVALDSPDFITAFSAVAATFNNIGPGLGMVGPAGSFADYSDLTKMVLSFSMLAGRLELYPILLLFMRHTWKKF